MVKPWSLKANVLPERTTFPCSYSLKAQIAEQARLMGSTQAELCLALLTMYIDRPSLLALAVSELRRDEVRNAA